MARLSDSKLARTRPRIDTMIAPRVSIVVPTYQENENVPLLAERIAQAMFIEGIDYELLLVDDDSGDGIEAAVAKLAKKGHPVRVIVRKGERGLSSAVLHGFQQARGDVLVCMDADLSHPPESIASLIRQVERPGVEMAIGSRYVRGGSVDEKWGLLRWLNSRVATLLARPFTRVRDPMSGYFALRRDVFARATRLNPVGYKIGLELIVKCRCDTVAEVPILFANRRHGRSKLTLREQVRYLKHLKRLAEHKFGLAMQVIEFCAVGATGVVVDLVTFRLLLGTMGLGGARALAIWTAMTWNFSLNRRLTFSYGRTQPLLSQYGRFVAGCSLGDMVSWSASMALMRWTSAFEGEHVPAALVGIVLGTSVNFVSSHLWAFRRKR